MSNPQEQGDTIRYTEIVDVDPETAFGAFVHQLHHWWPAIYTFADDTLDTIGIEPQEGGRCFERNQDGTELVWGEVLRYQPPVQIVFSWWIQPDRMVDSDRSHASEIEVRFIDERALTRVEFEHRHLSRHSGDWETMREAMRSRQGWPMLLQLYSDFANRQS